MCLRLLHRFAFLRVTKTEDNVFILLTLFKINIYTFRSLEG